LEPEKIFKTNGVLQGLFNHGAPAARQHNF